MSQSRARMKRIPLIAAMLVWASLCQPVNAISSASSNLSDVQFSWGTKIPMRDGVHLNATVYLPKNQRAPAPCVFTLTPYIADTYHDRGMYFAAHGVPFLIVDVRGRGNSEGVTIPFLQEAQDGYDIVEWLAGQPYCNGKVSMWGGSYAGYDQWATAKELPKHLATIVPVASGHPEVNFSAWRNNIFSAQVMPVLTRITGRASQEIILNDQVFWAAIDRAWLESGRPFKELDRLAGNPSAVFQQRLLHPEPDAYWDAQAPTVEQYRKLAIPILTITGSYDGGQQGALSFYQDHMRFGSAEAKARHYLIIGPWDHAGTRTPKAEFGGMRFGPASLVDLPQLHLEWYAWTMQGGPKPEFLRKRVAYYVSGAEKWRYADTLAAITARSEAYFLASTDNPTDVLHSGTLSIATAKARPRAPERRADHSDQYIYDPRDLSNAALESTLDPESLVDQQMIYAARGRELVYHSAPFEQEKQISGFFKLAAWLSIDQPDTDFGAALYEIGVDGSSILLSTDVMRARYRENIREPKLIGTKEPLRYDFERFTFVSRLIRKGSRLRLVLGPINSIYSEKNYNSGGVVAEESMKDARPVTVRLYHDRLHPSALYVPFGQAESANEPTAPAASLLPIP